MDHGESRPVNFREEVGMALFLIACGILAFLPTLNLPYVGDDNVRVFQNTALRGGNLWEAILGQLADRPLTIFTFWLEEKIFGLVPFISRSINVILHYAVAHVAFRIMFRESKNKTLAFFISLAFFVHAINSQAVIVSIQRGTILAVLFTLLALSFCQSKKYVWMSLFFLLGVLSKQLGVIFVFPLVFLLFKHRGTGMCRKVLHGSSLVAFSLIPLFFYSIEKTESYHSFLSPFEYFVIQVGHFPLYLSRILYPFNLRYMYEIGLNISPLSAQFVTGASLLTLIVSSCFFVAWKFNGKALFYSFLFFVSLLPEFSFFVIPHLFFEHRLYLPFLFFLIFIGILNPSWIRRTKAITISSVLIAFFWGATIYRSFEISSQEKWNEHIVSYPSNDYSFHYEIAFWSLKEDKNPEHILQKLEVLHYAYNSNLILLRSMDAYRKKKSEERLESMARILTGKHKINFVLRFNVNAYIMEELPLYTEGKRLAYLGATLVCPQLVYYSFSGIGINTINIERELLKGCLMNAYSFLEKCEEDSDDAKKIKRYVKNLKDRGLIAGPQT